MDIKNMKSHWGFLADLFTKDPKSADKVPTIKKLEIAAIAQSIKTILKTNKISNVLEVGSGEGYNLISLMKQFPDMNFTGIDYDAAMIKHAKELKADFQLDNIEYYPGNILEIDDNKNLEDQYDLIFTDRCVINLIELNQQFEALAKLAKKVKKNGYILLVENSTKTHGNQNQSRKMLGLEARIPVSENLFIDEGEFMDYAQGELNLELVDTVDFGSLHDIMLYVLIPKINGGKVDYAHPLMDAVTEFMLNIDPSKMGEFSDFGQNRLFIFKK